MKIGIIGAGRIAEQMALTLSSMDGFEKYAIASRDLAKASAFAQKWNFTKSYGSYQQLVDDPDVDLVYIATPHSHHFEHASLAIRAGKPVLCEKAFTANARQAEALLDLAHQRGVFITEAIWTRYMPLSLQIKQLIDSGTIGSPRMINASLCYALLHKPRILQPELCGGALLDLGVYCINFARMFFGGDIVDTQSFNINGPTGIDLYDTMVLRYADGRIANLQTGVQCRCNRQGLICGDDAFIEVDNVNCPTTATVRDRDYRVIAQYHCPDSQITGYEYQVYACRDAIQQGLLQSPYMPHQETLDIMKMMDEFRQKWGVRYPMD